MKEGGLSLSANALRMFRLKILRRFVSDWKRPGNTLAIKRGERFMTGKERMTRILQRKKADRIGLYEHFGEIQKNSGVNRRNLMTLRFGRSVQF
jgi:hypothetical protein